MNSVSECKTLGKASSAILEMDNRLDNLERSLFFKFKTFSIKFG